VDGATEICFPVLGGTSIGAYLEMPLNNVRSPFGLTDGSLSEQRSQEIASMPLVQEHRPPSSRGTRTRRGLFPIYWYISSHNTTNGRTLGLGLNTATRFRVSCPQGQAYLTAQTDLMVDIASAQWASVGNIFRAGHGSVGGEIDWSLCPGRETLFLATPPSPRSSSSCQVLAGGLIPVLSTLLSRMYFAD
jgi:hypothetical protein